jgi:hypothetical protein
LRTRSLWFAAIVLHLRFGHWSLILFGHAAAMIALPVTVLYSVLIGGLLVTARRTGLRLGVWQLLEIGVACWDRDSFHWMMNEPMNR